MSKKYVCSKCGGDLETDFKGDLRCSNCNTKHRTRGGGGGCLIFILIIAAVFMLEEFVVGALGVLDKKSLPFTEWVIDKFGESAALDVARESYDYFRERGTEIDFSFEDIEAVSAKTKEIDKYKIEIDESLSDINYDVINSHLFTLEQNIIFEYRDNVIKVDVSPGKIRKAKASAYYEKLFADLQKLPFGTYYIVSENEEKYILMNTGPGDGLENKKKTAVKVADNEALYNKLMSYGIEQIIDYKALRNKAISCYEFAGIRDYSIPSAWLDNGMCELSLREYQLKPGAYFMRNAENKKGTRHFMHADFYYSGVNKKVPKVRDYADAGN